MKRTFLIAAALLGAASAGMAQDVAKPQSGKAVQQDAPPMRTRLQIQRAEGTSAQAPVAAETTAAQSVQAAPATAQPAPATKAASYDAPPMRTRATLSTSAPNR